MGKKRSWAKIVLYIFVVLLYSGVIFFTYLGNAFIVTSISFFFLFFFFFDYLFLKLFNKWKSSNFRISYFAFFFSLLICDLSLRYIFKLNLSYTEQNGGLIYSCPYTNVRGENFIREYLLGERDLGIKIGEKNKKTRDSKSEYNYEIVTNSLGLRELEYQKEDLESSTILLGLGDSFCEGVGAPADSTWVNLLAQELKETLPDILSINAGVSGSDVIYQFYLLQNLLYHKFKPNIIVLSLNSSDIYDIVVRGGKERFVSKKEVRYNSGPWWSMVYANSFLFRLFAHEVLKKKWHLFSDSNFEQKSERAKEIIYNSIVTDFIPFAEENNVILKIAFTPVERELTSGYFPLESIFKALYQEYPNVVLNLGDDFGKMDKELVSNYFWEIDRHCNSKGYLFWAEAIASNLEAQFEIVNRP